MLDYNDFLIFQYFFVHIICSLDLTKPMLVKDEHVISIELISTERNEIQERDYTSSLIRSEVKRAVMFRYAETAEQLTSNHQPFFISAEMPEMLTGSNPRLLKISSFEKTGWNQLPTILGQV